jgi:hypothetical protein
MSQSVITALGNMAPFSQPLTSGTNLNQPTETESGAQSSLQQTITVKPGVQKKKIAYININSEGQILDYLSTLSKPDYSLGHVIKCAQVAPARLPEMLQAIRTLPDMDEQDLSHLKAFEQLQSVLPLDKKQATAMLSQYQKGGSQAAMTYMYGRRLAPPIIKDIFTKIRDEHTPEESVTFYRKLVTDCFGQVERSNQKVKNQLVYDAVNDVFHVNSKVKQENPEGVKTKDTHQTTLDLNGNTLGYFHVIELKPNRTDSIRAPFTGAIHKKTGTYFPPLSVIPAGTGYVSIKNGQKRPGIETPLLFRTIGSDGLPYQAQYTETEQAPKFTFSPFIVPKLGQDEDQLIVGHIYPSGGYDIILNNDATMLVGANQQILNSQFAKTDTETETESNSTSNGPAALSVYLAPKPSQRPVNWQEGSPHGAIAKVRSAFFRQSEGDGKVYFQKPQTFQIIANRKSTPPTYEIVE